MKKVFNQERNNNWFWLILVFLTLFFLGNNLTQLKRWWQINKLLDQEDDKVAKLEQEYQHQQEEKEYVLTDDYVLKEAREKLGLAKPGQARVIVPDLEITPTPVPIFIQSPWQKWWRLFLVPAGGVEPPTSGL